MPSRQDVIIACRECMFSYLGVLVPCWKEVASVESVLGASQLWDSLTMPGAKNPAGLMTSVA